MSTSTILENIAVFDIFLARKLQLSIVILSRNIRTFFTIIFAFFLIIYKPLLNVWKNVHIFNNFSEGCSLFQIIFKFKNSKRYKLSSIWAEELWEVAIYQKLHLISSLCIWPELDTRLSETSATNDLEEKVHVTYLLWWAQSTLLSINKNTRYTVDSGGS